MSVYVRKPGSTVIHIRVPDGDTTRCSERFVTTSWEIVVPDDRDWQNICPSCAGRPRPEAKSALLDGKRERKGLDVALREIDNP